MRAYNPGKDVKDIPKLLMFMPTRHAGLRKWKAARPGISSVSSGSETGYRIHSAKRLSILLEAISVAESVIDQSIEPESGGDKDKLAMALEIAAAQANLQR